jgi:hypothetical protein
MQKTFILVILIIFSSLAKSQDSTDYTLNNIKQYALYIEQSFLKISNNIEADKQQAVVQQSENIRANIDSIEEEMQYLPDEYYYRLSSLVSSYHTDVDEFEKIVLNKDFPDKDKYLAKSITSLRQRQSEFSKALDAAYATATGKPPLPGSKPGSDVIEEDTNLVVEPHSATKDTTAVNGSNVVLVEAVEPNEITTSNNAPLLDTIHQAQQQIEQWINSIHIAMKTNNYSRVGVDANRISNASLKIRDITLLLKTDQKESLYILATGLKNLSETLHELTLKGNAAHAEVQECIDKIAIKYNTLSTGISLVQ